MTFYVYTCPVCGAIVRIEHPSVQVHEIKVCVCPEPPVETTEEL